MLEKFGLRVHLAIIFAITTALLGLTFGVVVGKSVSSEMEHRIANGLAEMADELGSMIDHEVSARTNDLATAAAGLGSQSPAVRAASRQGWVDALQASPGHYAWVAVGSLEGRIETASPTAPAVGEDISRQPWFDKGRNGMVVIDEAADLPAGSTRPGVVIAVPVRDRNGHVVGVLAAQLGRAWAEWLSGQIPYDEGEMTNVDVYVTDSLGRPILGPGPLALVQLPPQLPAPGSGDAVVHDRLTWPDGSQYLTVATSRLTMNPRSGLGWRVVARREARQAMAPALALRDRVFTIGAALAVLGAALGGILAHRIARPLGNLADAAARIRSGELGVQMPDIRYFREVAVLSSALSSMVSSLRRNEARLAVVNAGLERRVAERTAEIGRALDQLVDREGKLSAVIDTAIDGVMIIDQNGLVETFNRACEHIFGWQAEEIIGQSVALLVPDEAFHRRATTEAGVLPQPLLDGVVGQTRTVQGMRLDGGRFPLEVALSRSDHGGKAVYVAILRDITAEVAARERMFTLATQDGLTGVRNRRYFMEGAEAEFARARRHQRSVALLILDADHFKQVNDTFGHNAGDAVLRRLAEVCRANLREIDVIGRIGGEEFAIAMPETDLDAARAAAERIRSRLSEQIVMVDGESVRFTVSVGIAMAEDRDNSIDDLMRRADQALYQAKHAGRNRVAAAVRAPRLINNAQ
jgi:diguanylate cyclase (GGDEF)-like protein/PAS domain S-box-containing protein